MSSIRWPLLVRKTHKWLALFVGIQVVLWTVTGFYMVAVHIDYIHGDHLVHAKAPGSFDPGALLPVDKALAAAPGATEITLVAPLGRPAWKARTPEGDVLLDGRTGARLPAFTEGEIRQIAAGIYTGNPTVTSIKLLTDAPQEMASRKPPFWQVEYEGWAKPTLYISPTTGELISRRHALWRVFDFAWMLHIMDYDERSNVNNPLLRIATWSAFAMAISGAWLLFWAFPRKKKKKAK